MNTGQLGKVAFAAQTEENRAAAAHRNDQRALDRSEQRLNQLQAFRLEYEQRLERMTSEGIDARQLADYRRFLSNLNAAIERQGQEVQRGQSAVDDSREALLQRAMRRDSLDQLLERARVTQHRENERREQKLIDETSLQRHSRSRA